MSETTADPTTATSTAVAGVAEMSAAPAEVSTCAEVAPAVVRCDAALTHVFEILGKRWNGIIVGALSAGPATFSQLARAVTGISDSVLSERLSGLTGANIVTRDVDSGPPVAVTYALTDAGRALVPALDELRSWANLHLTRR